MRRHEHHERSYSRHEYTSKTAFGCETGRIPFGRLGDLNLLHATTFLSFPMRCLRHHRYQRKKSILTTHERYSTPAKRGVFPSPFCICGDAWTRIDFSALLTTICFSVQQEQHGQMARGKLRKSEVFWWSDLEEVRAKAWLLVQGGEAGLG